MFLKDGSKEWILIHVEVQGRKENVFSERMFVYNYRIFDKYRRIVVSFAVLADNTESWRPSGFGYGRWGCRMRMDFPAVKLRDYAAQWEELEKSENPLLEKSENPFAVAVMAHLKAVETKKNRNRRRYWKLYLCKSLYSRGYSRNDVLLLFGFIDWLMTLPEEAEELFLSEMQAFEEERKMPYITSAERIGIKKGIEQGILLGIDQGVRQGLEKGLEQSIRRLLLKGIGPEETARLLDADKKTVLRIFREIRKSES